MAAENEGEQAFAAEAMRLASDWNRGFVVMKEKRIMVILMCVVSILWFGKHFETPFCWRSRKDRTTCGGR